MYSNTFSAPTIDTLFLLTLSILAMESVSSIRFLYTHFLSCIAKKSLNAFYYACSYARVDFLRFMNITTSLAVDLIREPLKAQPVFLCIDDTIAPKFGKKFEDVSILFDHAAHNGSNYLNGYCFVSLMLCVPVWNKDKIAYLSVPLGYRIWQKQESKLELAASMVQRVMPKLSAVKNVILLCNSWYAKKPLVCMVDGYENPDVICNARNDSVMYDLAQERTRRRGRPAKHGERLYPESDFSLSDEKVGDYHIGARKVLTKLFGDREVLAYVTRSEQTSGSCRLFFSTVLPHKLPIFCAWREKAPLNKTGSKHMQYIPLFLYMFRWNIEVSYYEQKTFWSLCRYMVQSRKGLEMLVNRINIAYCGMKILPYKEDCFLEYRNKSVQEFRFVISSQIREQVFYAHFVEKVETVIKSDTLLKALKQLIQQQAIHL